MKQEHIKKTLDKNYIGLMLSLDGETYTTELRYFSTLGTLGCIYIKKEDYELIKNSIITHETFYTIKYIRYGLSEIDTPPNIISTYLSNYEINKILLTKTNEEVIEIIMNE